MQGMPVCVQGIRVCVQVMPVCVQATPVCVQANWVCQQAMAVCVQGIRVCVIAVTGVTASRYTLMTPAVFMTSQSWSKWPISRPTGTDPREDQQRVLTPVKTNGY